MELNAHWNDNEAAEAAEALQRAQSNARYALKHYMDRLGEQATAEIMTHSTREITGTPEERNQKITCIINRIIDRALENARYAQEKMG